MTPAERFQLLQDLASKPNISNSEIASALGTTSPYVSCALIVLGIRGSRSPSKKSVILDAIAAKMKVGAIAKKFNVSRSYVSSLSTGIGIRERAIRSSSKHG